ncbi:hypothetical protein [Rathayibacter iranicus]|uniref:Uncharacterized protein n=1 Tax=Rathayibacter iranicus NCPPB 2253 = VKM Ac-1602 TaxID=1328868 RepID=A0ABX5LI55_9MICO|nr:hypothetical protein [Rathayibacter iranicus]PWJ65245.1 hypothetical protein B0H03_10392 [Rathayibacter iranicus NCPPB 2253 = VKM Ac-1602]
MPVVTVLPDRLELRLTAAERFLSSHRSDVVVDRSSIRSATVTEDPWIWVRGVRAPGTAIPLTLAAGTWKFHGGKDFLLIKRTASAVVIDLVGGAYARLIISTKHASELIAALQLGTTTAAIPVIETDDLVIVAEVAEQSERVMAADAGTEASEPGAAPESMPKATQKPQPGAAAKRKAVAKPKPAAEEAHPAHPAEPTPTSKPRSARADDAVGHASAEPSGATEAAE